MSATGPIKEPTHETHSRGWRIGKDNWRIVYAFLAAILLFVTGQLVHPGFANVASIESILTIASFVGLAAAGQTFVILIGGIDLSSPWVLNGAAILIATSSLGQDARTPYALVLTLGMGALAGATNGIGIAYFGVSIGNQKGPPICIEKGPHPLVIGQQ